MIFRGDIAQLGERCVRIAEVGGSNPPISTINKIVTNGKRLLPYYPAKALALCLPEDAAVLLHMESMKSCLLIQIRDTDSLLK